MGTKPRLLKNKMIMKISKIYPFLLNALFLIVVLSCTQEDRDTAFTDGIAVPSNLSLLVQITQDNTGTVTLTPSGESVAQYTIDFGDNSETAMASPGEFFTHIYQEGVYSAVLTATNLSGETASFTQEVVVSFLPPENLLVTITPVSGDAFSITVSATADLATGYEVTFGEDADQTPTPFMEGESVAYTYSSTGTFSVRVVAFAGSTATVESTTDVVVENPITLPVDFESQTIDYASASTSFGGAFTSLIDNPDPSGINTSATVVQFFKEPGAEVYAGGILELGSPIDFTEFQAISIKSWSPAAGLTVKLKLENGTDPNISAEIDAITTAVNTWEVLNFDFTGFTDQEYSKLVIFFDFGNPGTGTTSYFDDIEQSNGEDDGDGIALPIDFELPAASYTFLGFEGADSTIEMNPDMSGENTSNTVMQTIKTQGSVFYAGTFVDVDTAVDFSQTGKIGVTTWSPKANIPVRLAIENQTTGGQIFVDVNTTVENTWETLVFDFETLIDPSFSYNRIVIFFEFIPDLAGDGSTYYFDDIELIN
ncbi:MAG TPA: hypothetical protein DCL52_04630 [Flavobacteriaceae bacterium]|nr:hypothetical protein [Flavobacteriaceae bacterium]